VVDRDDNRVNIDRRFIAEYSSNPEVINFMKKQMKRLNVIGAINLIRMIASGKTEIHAKEIMNKTKTLLNYNSIRFNEDGTLKLEVIEELKIKLNGFLSNLGKDIIQFGDNDDDEVEFELKIVDGEEYYIVDRYTLYNKFRKLVCDERGEVKFKYNFIKSDMGKHIPSNRETLQRCEIQIVAKAVKFDYPIEYVYNCSQCEERETKMAYQTACTNTRISCSGIFNYIDGNGESKSRLCRTALQPDAEISLTKDAYYYDVAYEDIELNKHPAGALSFEKLEPGFYECVLFKIKNPKKTELFHIVDVKSIESNKFKLPKRKDKENYIITLQKAFDKFIDKQAKMEVYGMYPMKVAMIMQTAFNYLNLPLIANMQLVGDASTGKSTVLKYYGFLLNNYLNMSTNGLSISIPGLRGTKEVITLMGKEQKIVTTGYLGTFKSIHIDEAGENKVLVQNLKTFLYEQNYSYDKAGSTGIFNTRTTHINISENLDHTHLGQYRGAIRKAYKDDSFELEGETKEAWDESWDLHQPLYVYDNLYLRKVLKEKRIEYEQKQIWWIDGYDYALHQRFPFYFYLVNEKRDEKLGNAVKGNKARNSISENLQLMRVLRSDDILQFFRELNKNIMSETDIKSFGEVDTILENYGLDADARMKSFYYDFIKVSRIINGRTTPTEEDYDLLRWMLEKTNCKLDIADTDDYAIKGPPDIKEQQRTEMEIEEKTKEKSDGFGIPEDDLSSFNK